MRLFKYISVFLILTSCSNTNDELEDTNLSAYVANRTIETGAVIACAASDVDTNAVLVFYYPELGATNVRLYRTNSTNLDTNDFSNYTRLEINPLPFFNGYLEKVTIESEIEKFVIVTYEIDNEIKLSNPIRTKQSVKPTVWTDDVGIDQQQTLMPVFSWIDNQFGDNAIYFQVISNKQNDLLSGTYTFENQFQYYNTSNVVLNITLETPPTLSSNQSYNFTLMDVSEDNWVNSVIQKSFIAQ